MGICKHLLQLQNLRTLCKVLMARVMTTHSYELRRLHRQCGW